MPLLSLVLALLVLSLAASSAQAGGGPYLCFYGEEGTARACKAADADASYDCRIEGGTYEYDGTCTPGEKESTVVCDEEGNCVVADPGCFYDDGTMEFCSPEESEMNRWCNDAGGRWSREGRCRRRHGRPPGKP